MRDVDTHKRQPQLHRGGHQAARTDPAGPPPVRESAAERKRKLLDFVVSNCRWKDGQLAAEYRKPFDVLALAVAADQRDGLALAQGMGKNENWLPETDENTNSRMENFVEREFSGC